jgi:dienelactone hydrolase
VVCVQEWWGVVPALTAHARKIADMGYRVVVPDLYRGKAGYDVSRRRVQGRAAAAPPGSSHGAQTRVRARDHTHLTVTLPSHRPPAHRTLCLCTQAEEAKHNMNALDFKAATEDVAGAAVWLKAEVRAVPSHAMQRGRQRRIAL